MTEKRFRAVVCVTDWYIEDKEISPFAVLTPHQSSDLLNKLYNENEQLKEEIQQCRDYNAKIYSNVAQNEIILSRENKQLKQTIAQLVKESKETSQKKEKYNIQPYAIFRGGKRND